MPVAVGDKFSGGRDPFQYVEWTRRDVRILEVDGRVAFQQDAVEAPRGWSDRAVEQPARLYFRTVGGRREDSVADLVRRVVTFISAAALSPDVGTPLIDPSERTLFERELARLILNQSFAYNTPVWVNAGAPLPEGEKPQCSACFIQRVDDTMESITALQVAETMLFRRGSGTGTNWSTLRPAGAPLSRGGNASGPVSFMLGYDAWAAVTKSGGSSRRAAKMNCLNVSHPDIFAFVDSKVQAGRMIAALVAAGWDPDFNSPATAWARYQNANHSVRVTRGFLDAVAADADWLLTWEGEAVNVVKARALWEAICAAAWETGDPGLQFDDEINLWHTSPATGRINASNPCSEYMFLDDSSCNLASHRLRRYWDPERRTFRADRFAAAVRLGALSQEAIVSAAGYPTAAIARNSRDFRPLGQGYADLGALLMGAGLAYGSPEGRGAAAAVTALLGGVAALTSAEIARDCGGPYPGWTLPGNSDAMMSTVARHREHATRLLIGGEGLPGEVRLPAGWEHVARAALDAWLEAERVGAEHGFRNAQWTVLAPTGTIGFMMDCDTTGVEPDVALVKHKRLAGGGSLRLVNRTVKPALLALGYSEEEATKRTDELEASGRLHVKPEHAPVFACAFGSRDSGWPVLRAEDHVLMVAAVQPYLSGAVSKTVNMGAEATPADVSHIYLLAAEHRLKAVAVFRDGSKGSQPVTVGKAPQLSSAATAATAFSEGPPTPAALNRGPTEQLSWGTRKKMPAERRAVCRRFCLEGHDLYVHVGFHNDGTVGEFFFTSSAKEGTTLSGIFDALARAVSLALQHGASLDKILEDFRGTKFEPSGWLGDEEFCRATSFLDAVAKWARAREDAGWPEAVLHRDPPSSALEEAARDLLSFQSGGATLRALTPGHRAAVERLDAICRGAAEARRDAREPVRRAELGGRLCPRGCGPMIQDGTCWRCSSCGDSSGGCGG